MPQPLTKEDYVALAELAKARRQLVVNMFSGTQLKFGQSELLKAVQSLSQNKQKVQKSFAPAVDLAKGAAKGAAKDALFKAVPELAKVEKAIEEFIVQCADIANIDELIALLGLEAYQNLVAEAVPYFSIAYSSGKLGVAAARVAKDGYDLFKSRQYKTGFRTGDPLAAAEAVQKMIERDLARHSVNLGLNTVSTGLKIAGLFVDFGTATTVSVGVASSLANFGLKLAALGVDIRDMRAGNRRLAKPETLDLTVFEECPLLGCYLITCADTSQVANVFLSEFGLPGWKERLEVVKRKKMEPLIKIAAKSIQSSRLQLEGLASNKGTHMEKDFFAKVKSKAVQHIKAKAH